MLQFIEAGYMISFNLIGYRFYSVAVAFVIR